MPLRFNSTQYTRDGRPFVKFFDWLETLTPEEQQEYYAAMKRQHAYRQDAIDRGDLTLLPDQSYVWKDAEALARGKPIDPVWAKYHDRWVEENAIVGKTIIEEI